MVWNCEGQRLNVRMVQLSWFSFKSSISVERLGPVGLSLSWSAPPFTSHLGRTFSIAHCPRISQVFAPIRALVTDFLVTRASGTLHTALLSKA